jgi:PAS domain S-box-containing protein
LLSWQSAPSFEGIFVHDKGVILAHNEIAAQLLGWDASLVGRNLIEFVAPEGRELVLRNIAAGSAAHFESVILRRDGTRVVVEVLAKNTIVDGQPCRVVAYRDLTERRRLEERLRETQKMEAIGLLAGGVAHDFNNSLTTIIGAASLLGEDLASDPSAHARASQIRRSAERAAALTRQLLAFGRRQVLHAEIVRLDQFVLELRDMLASVLTERTALSIEPDPDLGAVLADPSQLEQVLLNLALNARDAMPNGGCLELRACNVEVAAADDPALPPGRYVKLSVRDDGTGMDEQTRARVFEPFFTTKAPDSGTGLGLSSVYGIVKQSGGHVTVESELGRGSTFHLWLPRAAESPRDAGEPKPDDTSAAPAHAGATILVVEDDADLREIVAVVLRRHGHRVWVASDGAVALDLAERHLAAIDLLLCDVVMPKLSGPLLAERLVAQRPELRVLFMSGHPYDPNDRSFRPILSASLLAKPFDEDTLVARIRTTLAAERQA